MKGKEKKEKKTEKETEKNVRPMAITLKAVVVNQKNEVLLLKRNKKSTFNRGKWDLPGGHIDEGETIEEGLKREILEETSLKAEVGFIIGTAEFSKGNKQFKNEKRGLRFLAYSQGDKVKLNKREHDEYAWLPIDEAIEKLSKKDGFEGEKRETLFAAKEYLEMKNAVDNWKRSVAEFENYKKRQAKNNEDFKKYSNEDMILEILPVLDNFDAAINHAPEEEKENGWMTGIIHIQKQLMDVLESKGVKEIAVKKGDKVDESIHEVVSGKVHPVKSGEAGPAAREFNKVKKILKKGYKIADRVIRPASVEVE